MPLVFLPQGPVSTGRSNIIIKSHAAKLAAEKRRLARKQRALDCLNGAPLPTDHVLIVKLPNRQQPKALCGVADAKRNDDEQVDESQENIPQPGSLLNPGNSDPFNATVLIIDPTANDLLVFNRDCFLPWINGMEKGKDQESSYNNKFVQDVVTSLHQPETAHASLASLAMVVANSTGSQMYESYARSLIAHAYASLKKHLKSVTDNSGLALRIFALLVFELIAQNSRGAASHTQALQDVLEIQVRTGQTVNPHLINAAGWIDNVRCLKFLAPSIMKAEVLLAPYFLGEVNDFAQRLKQHGLLDPEPPQPFHKTGIPPKVRHILAQLMYLIRVGQSFPLAPWLMTDRTSTSWAHTAHILVTKLNNLFHESRNSLRLGVGDPQLLRREMATSLSGFYWAYAVSNFEFLDLETAKLWKHGYPSLSVSSTMLAALSEQIYAIDWRYSEDSPPSLRLWLLYIVTLAEQALANFSGSLFGYRSEHNRELVRQAVYMGLEEWQALEAELERYLYSPDKTPGSRSWFEKAIEEHLADLESSDGIEVIHVNGSPATVACEESTSPNSSSDLTAKTPDSTVYFDTAFDDANGKGPIRRNTSLPIIDETWHTGWHDTIPQEFGLP